MNLAVVVVLDEAQLLEFVHEKIDPGPRCANLTACIPESAIRKFAAKEPFSVHIDDGTIKFFVFYFGH